MKFAWQQVLLGMLPFASGHQVAPDPEGAAHVAGNLRTRVAPAVLTAVASQKDTAGPMPQMLHDKVAGNGYLEGSPLYDKQETRKKQGTKSTLEPAEEKGYDLHSHYDFDHHPDTLGSKPGFATDPLTKSYKAGWDWHENAYPDTLEYTKDSIESNKYYQDPGSSTLEAWKSLVKYPWITMSFYVIHITAVLCFAYAYMKFKPKLYEATPAPPHAPKEWNYGLFSVQDFKTDSLICCMACLCIPIRWADTVSNERVIPGKGAGLFWQALILFLLLQTLGVLTFGVSSLVLVCIAIYTRRRIRKVYGLEQSTTSLFQDMAVWFCCACCAAVQEARQIEHYEGAALSPKPLGGPTIPQTAQKAGPFSPPASGVQSYPSSSAYPGAAPKMPSGYPQQPAFGTTAK